MRVQAYSSLRKTSFTVLKETCLKERQVLLHISHVNIKEVELTSLQKMSLKKKTILQIKFKTMLLYQII